ncbi:Probable RNA-directed DNA polymerase from transposon BS [Eumeta japonica]|uniref:Probable RNA-directed DNA polymerase from transposon BS n=1 Tax=Eumeta variegata TaxID=151549 RepID=A0A4C1TJM2_EUMVA|nr:Probable RNA-directed DNA polymerase from transposon BS [Eumeta japonica]
MPRAKQPAQSNQTPPSNPTVGNESTGNGNNTHSRSYADATSGKTPQPSQQSNSKLEDMLLKQNPFAAPYLQATSIRVEDRSGFLNLSAIYCPPRHTIKEEMFSDFFKTLGNRFIAGGDWNAKHSHWGSRITNTLIKSSLDGSSDHTPVILILSPIAIPHDSGTDYLHNSKTDWDCFREYLESNIDLKLSLKTNEEVDNASLYITNLIQIWKHVGPNGSRKSEAFAIHLSSVFKPNDADTPEDPEIEAILKQDLQMCLPLRHTTPKN